MDGPAAPPAGTRLPGPDDAGLDDEALAGFADSRELARCHLLRPGVALRDDTRPPLRDPRGRLIPAGDASAETLRPLAPGRRLDLGAVMDVPVQAEEPLNKAAGALSHSGAHRPENLTARPGLGAMRSPG